MFIFIFTICWEYRIAGNLIIAKSPEMNLILTVTDFFDGLPED